MQNEFEKKLASDIESNTEEVTKEVTKEFTEKITLDKACKLKIQKYGHK